MALKNVPLFLRKSKSGKGLTLSGDEVGELYTVSVSQVLEVIKGEREYVSLSKVVDDEEDSQENEEVEKIQE